MPSLAVHNAVVPRNKNLKDVLGANVRAARRVRQMSQPQVAAAAKMRGVPIDQTSVGRIERGAFPATVDTLLALATGLGFEPWQLLHPFLDAEHPEKLGAELTQDEKDLLDLYRKASGRWKIAVRYMAGLRHDAQQEEAVTYLMSKIFATPVTDAQVAAAFGPAPHTIKHREPLYSTKPSHKKPAPEKKRTVR